MALIFASWKYDISAIILVTLYGMYRYLIANYDYWKKKNIYFLKPQFFFGNIRDMILLRKSQCHMFQDLYNQLEGHKYGGIFQFWSPTLILRDPDIIKSVLVKDFAHFQDRGLPVEPEKDPLSQHLFRLGGWKWKQLRAKLTPTFTSGKMKMMFQTIEVCADHLHRILEEPAAKGEILELKEFLAKFSTDIIGTCAFGLQMNALDDPDSEFRKWGKKIFEASFIGTIKRFIALFLPLVRKLLVIDEGSVEMRNFFLNITKETVEYREKNQIRRNDFMQLLIDMKNKNKMEENKSEIDGKDGSLHKKEAEIKTLEIDDGFLAAQAFVFFLAGFETSSSAMSFTLHELAVNPDVQDRLQEEIDSTLEECNGKITYEALVGMKYLDKVICETLRKYPALGALMREVTIPYTLPDKKVTLDKGVKIAIPVYALHYDPQYFPNPEVYDPERFSEEEKAKRPHYVYLPFGEGPRNCIGMRFGLLQTKMGLFTLLSKYRFHVCEKTVNPLVIHPRSVVTASVSGTILRITKRS